MRPSGLWKNPSLILSNDLIPQIVKKYSSRHSSHFARKYDRKKKLKQASTNLDKSVDELQNALGAKTYADDNKDIFKSKEVYDAIRHQIFSIKKGYEQILDSKFGLQQKIITPNVLSLWQKISFYMGI